MDSASTVSQPAPGIKWGLYWGCRATVRSCKILRALQSAIQRLQRQICELRRSTNLEVLVRIHRRMVF